MNKRLVLSTILVSGLCSQAVVAEDIYLGSKVGISNLVNGCENNNNCEEESFGLGIYAGYNFNQYIAAEIGYDYIGNFQANFAQLDGNIAQKEMNLSALTFAPKITLPISNDLGLFGKIGAAQLLSSSESDMVTMAGLGLEYAVNYNVKLRGEYQYFHDMQDKEIRNLDANIFSLGVSYTFGEPPKTVVVEKPTISEEPVAVVVSHPDVIQTVLFEFDSTLLEDKFYQGLQEIVTLMENYPDTQATVLGYADTMGNPIYNLKLSKQRAEVVAQFLIERGITSDRLQVSGEGETNESDDDKYNRHVDVTVDTFKYKLPADK